MSRAWTARSYGPSLWGITDFADSSMTAFSDRFGRRAAMMTGGASGAGHAVAMRIVAEGGRTTF